jgi:hypothetical protein
VLSEKSIFPVHVGAVEQSVSVHNISVVESFDKIIRVVVTLVLDVELMGFLVQD